MEVTLCRSPICLRFPYLAFIHVEGYSVHCLCRGDLHQNSAFRFSTCFPCYPHLPYSVTRYHARPVLRHSCPIFPFIKHIPTSSPDRRDHAWAGQTLSRQILGSLKRRFRQRGACFLLYDIPHARQVQPVAVYKICAVSCLIYDLPRHCIQFFPVMPGLAAAAAASFAFRTIRRHWQTLPMSPTATVSRTSLRHSILKTQNHDDRISSPNNGIIGSMMCRRRSPWLLSGVPIFQPADRAYTH